MTEEMTKDKAIRYLLLALSNPLFLMSVPDKEKAMELAKRFNVTVLELLEAKIKRSQNM
jgi:hypothetical protein